ncbi:MAG: flippase-like domain-containing protein, partial [Planctomycetota bacterium]
RAPHASSAPWPPEVAEKLARGERVALERQTRDRTKPRLSWQPGLPRVFREVELGWVAAALACFLAAFACGTTRWWRLLRVAGCASGFWDSLRLNFLGLFFNLVMPGLTGGDVVKMGAVALENPGKRLEAALSALVDRVLGLLVLVVLAAAVILASGDAGFDALRKPVLLLLAAMLAGALVYFAAPLRRALGWEKLCAHPKLGPKLRLLDGALLVYARHPLELAGCAVLSLANHCGVICGVALLGHAYGVRSDEVSLAQYFVIVPVASMVTALPIAPAGWGLGEAVYQYLFELIGASGALGVAVSVTFRLTQMLIGCAGGLFLLAPGARSRMRAARAAGVEGAVAAKGGARV